MSTDWIKVEHVTPEKPEVIDMAEILNIDQDAVFGKLLRLWIWADQQCFCNAASVTENFVDRKTRVTGFARAMVEVGWLIPTEGRLTFSNFDRHNGQTAKARGVTSKRVKKHRGQCNGDVTQAPLQKPLPEGEGEGEGEFPLSETRRDETALCDFFSLQKETERFRRFGLLEKPQDRSLVAKLCVLSLIGKFPRDWLEQWIEALGKKKRSNYGAFLTACAKTKTDEAKMNLKTMLATVVIPKPPQEPKA